jgi:radical SAM-linked protein
MRYTSHLDTHRALERTFRRAHLPLVYSQCYNPKPKISMAAALPLGITSDCELADFWLESLQPTGQLQELLNEKAPPGLHFFSIEEIEKGEPALQVQIQAATYSMTLVDPPSEKELQTSIRVLLETHELIRERRGKQYDLRPLIEELWLESHSPHEAIICTRLTAKEGQTGRPEEILLALEFDPTAVQIHRRSLHL